MRRHHRCIPIHKRLCMVLALSFLCLSCATVPYTGRKSLNLVSDAEMVSLSLQQYAQVMKEAKLSGNARDVRMVKDVGQRIASASETFLRETGRGADIQSFQWEFNLIDDAETVNAWCMPGGKVAVYTGLLPLTKDETGLAVVMGHEIAHALARHGNERMSETLLVQLGGMGLALALSQKPKATQDLFLALYGISSQVGFMLPYSRLHEAEADRIGLMLMARAGYDPREAVALWERMAAQGGSRPPQFLSTHPAPESRIANLKALIPEVMPYYHKGSGGIK
ncbi:MAG: M48 family metallopeptidase [Deltaproteobacteria bacterium]|nr:M48 family metallopeptidase [Deltaproteobacteria bacterium]